MIFFLPALSKIELAGRLPSGCPCPRLALGCSGGHRGAPGCVRSHPVKPCLPGQLASHRLEETQPKSDCRGLAPPLRQAACGPAVVGAARSLPASLHTSLCCFFFMFQSFLAR